MNLFALVNGAPWIFGPVTFSGPITFTGDVTIGGTLGVTGAGSFGGNLTVSGVTTSAGISNSGALTFTAAAPQAAGSIAKNATYGLTYYGITGSSYDFTLLNKDGNIALSNPTGTTNIGVGGNLTVSGTGSSSVAGTLVAGTSSADSTGAKAQITGALVVYGGAITNAPTAASIVIDQQTGGVARIMASGASTWSVPLAINPYGGNLLLGTTTDGGQKLQVNGTANVSSDFTNYGKRTLRGTSSNPDAANVPVACEFSKSTGNTAATTATVVITGTLGACNNWREALVEVYAAGCNIYSGTEGSVNELVQFQHASNTALNPRNFTVVRTNAAGSAITIAYAGTGPTTFTITVTKTDASVPGVVPSQELWVTVKVTASTTVSLA